MKKFKMTNIDAMVAYDKFFKKYPNGELTKEQFMEVKKDLFSDSIFSPEIQGIQG